MTLNEQVLASMLERHPDPVVYHTPVFSDEDPSRVIDFVLVYCNECQRLQSHLPVDQMIGQKVSELYGFTEEGRRRLFRELHQVYSTGADLENTYYNELQDVYFNVQRKKVEGGVYTVARNVTGEVKARQEKEQQGQLVDLILNTSLNAWFICDAVQTSEGEIVDFTITRINPLFTRFLGLTEEKVVGKSYLSLFPSSRQQGFFDLDCRVVKTGVQEKTQMSYQAEGRTNWYDVVVTKLGHRSLLITFADITEQRKNKGEVEQKNALLDNILLHSANGISVTEVIRDSEGRVVDGKTILANDAAVAFTGLPKDIYLGKTAVEIEPNIVQTPYFQMCLHTLETGEPSFVQYQMESTGHWLEISVSRMDMEHIITIFTDVTKAKEAQLQQEKLLEELTRSNAALEEFTRASSHDLKEPVRKVHFFIERIRASMDSNLTPEQASLFERVGNATRRMQLLIDDLLEYSHLSQSTPEEEEIDLNEKLKLILSDLELLIQEKNASVRVGRLPVVRGYRRQLQQLFQNLITNGLKYAKTGVPPEITITSREIIGKEASIPLPALTQSQPFHLIEVCDNGIGFDQSDAERIFYVFTRLHGNKEYPGTGIGLSIAKKVVENHKGYIYAKGESGKGACFMILLPVMAQSKGSQG